ncbi:MAG: crotonase/enoyl-CoA hydratase family protein [Sphingomonadaceae bacterium]|nr:crotonase/enoyl-CoA hydratase family protein [Sphingomonadaceae bacterium]
MAPPEQIKVERSGNILLITLHRPDAMNAFTTQMKDELVAALDEADGDDAVRAVIFTGDGTRAYCAGADLSAGAATFDYDKRRDKAPADGSSPTRSDGSIDYAHPMVRDSGGVLTSRIFAAKKPVIGAINGAAVGIGVTMTLPMDMRLASDNARFGFVFARRGIVPEAASSWYLPRLVGLPRALDWCMSGRIFDAAEARDAGLVQSVHAPGELVDAAMALATKLTEASSPVSIAATRHMLWRMAGAPHPNVAHRWDSRMIYARGRMADAREGVVSFLEKRPAQFTDSVADAYPHFSPFDDDPDYG